MSAVWIGSLGKPIRVVQRARLCARAAITVQALLRESGRRGSGEGLVLEVADPQLDRGVVAMIDVGNERRELRLVANA